MPNIVSPEMITEPNQIAPYIQHTKIGIGTTKEESIRHAEEAAEFGFNAAMVSGSCVPITAEVLRGTGIEIASALDFPTTGVMTSRGKAAEAEELVRLGATQIDIGVQIGWLKDKEYKKFRDDIAGVVEAGVPIKVMLELPLLSIEERKIAVELAIEAGAKVLKNASSGAVEKASVESIKFLKELAPEGIQVKGSGGISTFEHALELLKAGASLVGSSNSIAIVSGADNGAKSY
ncbi:deoxyribose-phosphate aldolase [Corynebacterium minutissimum]|uniref:deoxyribose-phosphate aldolase n=1 Tax=Corynebacterium minutissimum TaxID=38301 RepID=UPI001EF17687|nr:deoxyribose-phosphate aldolase [Corynebacterium minutissimum]MCG7228498.1 deoxyribose-phosphate aldolase [Corynebacterium minutissimum]MCG7237615.1 deoxyribose-phosphate aldolase [Corynebacterium minutissimum]